METKVLWQRELIGPGYKPTMMPARFDDEEVTVLAFVADHDAEMVLPDLPHEKQVEYIATGEGILGTAADYLQDIATKLRDLNIQDADVEALLRDVNAYQAAHRLAVFEKPCDFCSEAAHRCRFSVRLVACE